MYDICCIGHITKDRVVTPKHEIQMAGGTALYFSNAIRNLGVRYCLVTSLAETEMHYVDVLQDKGINVQVYPSPETVYFENIYEDNQDHRRQRVLQIAAPFNEAQLKEVDAALFHLGPLLAEDFSPGLMAQLAKRATLSLDVQGLLRKVEQQKVVAVDWKEKQQLLPHIKILKANESEAAVLTGEKDPHKAALILADWGVEEVVITMGSLGSLVRQGGSFFEIPAFKPAAIVDATGCGDTYMAGYLAKRINGAGVQESAEFAAAMASLKIAANGPFNGNVADVVKMIGFPFVNDLKK